MGKFFSTHSFDGRDGQKSALTTSDFVNFAEDFVEEPEKKILQVFDAVSKFQSLCATYGIDKAYLIKSNMYWMDWLLMIWTCCN